jgi:aspartyl-tRNA(Asn)/glutamyl-tRNA(Gln) amidotransferase subunit A
VTLQDSHQLGVGQLTDAYRQQSLAPGDVCEHLLARIDDARINCNAFAYIDHDAARREAQASEQRWRDGCSLGPLDGIPVAIKDVLDVAGMPTRYGSAACSEVAAATQDCLLVQRLCAAGAIVLGKTRTWEFAWRSNPERDPAEVVTNPRNPAHSPGGSSTGSAAAVAAQLCPLAFGTDSGGSVRGPASFCGIVGLKPSHAMIPVFPSSPMGDLEHIGIFARSVKDVRSALDQVGGYHPDDPASWSFSTHLAAPPATPKPDLSGFRFACSVDLNYADPQPELRRRFATIIEQLLEAGLNLSALNIPFDADFDKCYDLFVPDAALSIELAPASERHRIDPEILALTQQAHSMSAYEYAKLELLRVQTQRVFAEIFGGIDCLLSLTQETTANRLEQQPRIMKLTRCFNITGQPAISIPCGLDSSGLPIGLQLICDKGRDDLLLVIAERIAAELSQA